MEIISSLCNPPLYESFSGNLLARYRYKRLSNTIKRKKNVKVLRLGGKKVHRFWKVRAVKKLRLKILSTSTKLLMTKLRDAYVDFMYRLAGNIVSLSDGGNVLAGCNNNAINNKRIVSAKDEAKSKKTVDAPEVTNAYSSSEYDEKLVFEIYKVLLASQ